LMGDHEGHPLLRFGFPNTTTPSGLRLSKSRINVSNGGGSAGDISRTFEGHHAG